MRSQHGQASLEYLGIIALVAVVVGAFAAPAMAGQDIAGAVAAQMRRALCVVGRGDCEEDRRPCAVDTHSVRESQHVSFAIVRYGQDRFTLVEKRSDGTVAVTLIKDHRPGLAAGFGVDTQIGSHAFGVALHGALLARLGSGSTMIFPNAAEADHAMELMASGRRPPGVKRVRLLRGGLGAELDAVGTQGTLHVADDVIAGRSVDEDSGLTTYALHGDWDAHAVLGIKKVGSGTADAGVDLAVTMTRTRDGRFVDLGFAATGDLAGAASLPRSAGPVAGLLDLSGSVAGGRRWALEQHLDLTTSENREAAAAFVAALSHPEALAAATRELAARFVAGGVTDVRTYRLAVDDDGVSADVGVGGKFGAGDVLHDERAQLLSAFQRGPDGLWRERSDCLGGGSTRTRRPATT